MHPLNHLNKPASSGRTHPITTAPITASKSLALALGLGIGLSLSQSASAAFDFTLSAILPTQGLAEVVRIGDVTGDGLVDTVLVNNGYSTQSLNNHVLIYPGHESGGLSAPLTLAYPGHVSGQRGLVLMNTDDDDTLEIIVGHDRNITAFNQTNDDGFSTQTITTNFNNHLLEQLDIDLDGQSELAAIQSYGSLRQAVFYDVTDWSVVFETDLTGLGDRFELATADVTGDDLSDLILVNKGSSLYSDLSVLPHTGQTGLSQAVTYSFADSHALASGLAIGDFNNDGLTDAIVTQQAQGQSGLFQQDGFGDLWHSTNLATLAGAQLAEGGDLNRDGLADWVVLHHATDQQGPAIGFSIQHASGLSPEQLSLLPSNLAFSMQSLALGDINQDGCTDAAIADHNQGLILFNGAGCENGADLSIQVKQRGNQVVIRGSHLSGLGVEQAKITAELRTNKPVRFYVDGCDLTQVRRGVVQAHCEVGRLEAGERRAFHFWADTSQALEALKNIGVTASIDSERTDPNPDNNTTVHN